MKPIYKVKYRGPMSLHLQIIGSKRTPYKLRWDIRHEGFFTPLQKPPFFFLKKYHGTFPRLTPKVQNAVCCTCSSPNKETFPQKNERCLEADYLTFSPWLNGTGATIQAWICRVSNRHDCRFVSEASIRNKCCAKLKRKKAFGHLG